MNDQDNAPAGVPENSSLLAEADAALAGAPEGDALTDATPAAEVATDTGVPWAPFLHGTRPLLFGFVLPQWEVSEAEQREWTEALAACCDQLFPGGIDGKYGCYVRLIGASIAIVGGRMIANGGKLPPIGPKRAQVTQGDAAAAPA